MSQLQTLTPKYAPAALPQVRGRQPVRPEAPPALYRCLVVSTCAERRRMLREAAEAQGWDPIVTSGVEQASREIARNRLQLVIVDLEGAGRGAAPGFFGLAQRLAGESGRLVVVCGNEGDVMEEIWARQLGAWMYLPGVDDQSDVAMVCGEARNVAERLLGGIEATQVTAM
jgi:hypothetical protein